MSTQPIEPRDTLAVQEVAERAIQAFFASVAAQLPHIKTGDFPTDAGLAFEAAASQAVMDWVDANTD